MASKTILFLGLAFAVVLLIASDVAARDLAETTSSTLDTNDHKTEVAGKEANAEKVAKPDQFGGGYPGGGYGGYPGGGYGGYPGGGYGGYPGGGFGGRGRGYGGGGRGYGGYGRGGYGGRGRGRGCYYGYCYYGCCRAADAQTLAKPQN